MFERWASCVCVCLCAGGAALAQSSPERITFASCAACHGDGTGPGAIPAILGEPYEDLVADLSAFAETADGTTIMHRFAVALSVPEIEALARYVSGLEGEAR